MNEHILIVDDERELAELVSLYLTNAGFRTSVCPDGASAWRSSAAKRQICALGRDAARYERIRYLPRDPQNPFLSDHHAHRKNRGQRQDPRPHPRADDYITKPFNPLEVVARVRTQLRRASTYNHAAAPESAEEIDIRGLVINRAAHSCSLYGEQIALTPLEFEILWYLASNQGRVVPSEELFEAVWQEKYFKSNNTVMSHIGRLRDKLHEPAKHPKFIKTVWGIGYEIE